MRVTGDSSETAKTSRTGQGTILLAERSVDTSVVIVKDSEQDMGGNIDEETDDGLSVHLSADMSLRKPAVAGSGRRPERCPVTSAQRKTPSPRRP